MYRALVVIAVLLVSSGAIAGDEPSCDGVPASEWAERILSSGPMHRNDPLHVWGGRLAKHREKAIPVVRWLYENGQARLRQQAVLVPGSIPFLGLEPESHPTFREAVPLLIRALSDKNKWVRRYAARSLGRCLRHRKRFRREVVPWRPDGGPLTRRAIPALAVVVRDPFGTARRDALVALSGVGSFLTPAARRSVLAALNDPVPEVRSQAMWILPRLRPGPDALPHLFEAAARYEKGLPRPLARALVHCDPDLDEVLPLIERMLADPETSDDAAWAIGKEGVRAIPALTRLVKWGQASQKQEAVVALGRIGPPARSALPAMRCRLTTHSAEEWAATVLALWRVGGDTGETLRRLRPKLEMPGDSVWHGEAVQVVGQMGPAAKPLLPLIKKDLSHPKEHVRKSAAWARSEIREEPRPQPTIEDRLKALASDRPWVRGEAVEHLGGMKKPPDRAIAAVRGCLEDTDIDVRLRAAVAIVRMIGDDRAWRPVVKAALRSEDWVERGMAAEAVFRIAALR